MMEVRGVGEEDGLGAGLGGGFLRGLGLGWRGWRGDA